MAGGVCPAKKISSLTDQNTSFTHPYPPGLRAWGSQAPGLSAPTLRNGTPWLLKHRKGLPAGYRRQAGAKVLLQI